MSTDITMTFEDFCNEAKRYFEHKYPEAEVIIKKVTKNNGLVLTGLSVKKGEDVLPMAYLESYWKMFRTSEDLPKIFKEIDETLSKGFEFPKEISKEDLFNLDKCKHLLCLRVINKEKNKDLLTNSPYITVLDLAVTFYIYLGDGASITVMDDILANWGIDKETFIKEYIPVAMENTNKLLPGHIFNMVQFIKSISDIISDEDDPEDLMYIMTNPAKYFGAAGIATEGAKLKKFAEEHRSGFYILPSSIHELIFVVSDYNRKDTKSLYRLVRDVNRTLSPDDVLSDNVYYFDREKGYPIIAE